MTGVSVWSERVLGSVVPGSDAQRRGEGRFEAAIMDVVVRSNGAEWTQAEATVVETRHNKAFLVDSILATGVRLIGVYRWIRRDSGNGTPLCLGIKVRCPIFVDVELRKFHGYAHFSM